MIHSRSTEGLDDGHPVLDQLKTCVACQVDHLAATRSKPPKRSDCRRSLRTEVPTAILDTSAPVPPGVTDRRAGAASESPAQPSLARHGHIYSHFGPSPNDQCAAYTESPPSFAFRCPESRRFSKTPWSLALRSGVSCWLHGASRVVRSRGFGRRSLNE